MTDYKELCAELVTELEGWCGTGTYDNTVNAHSVIDRARALLAQPEPKGPTDEDVFDLYEDLGFEMSNFEESAGILLEMFRAILARWGSGRRSINLFPRPPMTDLSPAAQAVLDAFFTGDWEDEPLHSNIAAALRAAADQVAPSDADEPRNYLPMAIECQRIRQDVLDIADELENQ